MNDLVAGYRYALCHDFMVFYEKCFALLESGTEFLDNWHFHAIAEALRKVECGDTRRLIINVPPRSGKSLIVTVAFTAWLLGRSPHLKIICTSYSESLARTHASAFRAIVHSRWYRQAFPAFQIERGGDRSVETVTTQRGFRYAVSLSGPVLGRGADIIIGDDAISPASALSDVVRARELAIWDTAHRTRLNSKRRGSIILVSQRLHAEDLVGHVMETGDWERLIIPATATAPECYALGGDRVYHREAGEVLHEERESSEALQEMHRAIGPMHYAAQYMQDPVPPDGNLLHRDWLRFYRKEPAAFETLVATWDTATTLGENSSFSVGMLWGSLGTDYYLLELLRERLEAPDLRRKMIECQTAWQPDAILIENTELGRSLAQDLRRTERMRVLLRKPRYDKKARLLAQLARFEAGQVHLPQEASWLDVYVKELLAFPYGKHDDQVDATSQVLDYFSSLLPRQGPIVRRNPGRRSIVCPPDST